MSPEHESPRSSVLESQSSGMHKTEPSTRLEQKILILLAWIRFNVDTPWLAAIELHVSLACTVYVLTHVVVEVGAAEVPVAVAVAVAAPLADVELRAYAVGLV